MTDRIPLALCPGLLLDRRLWQPQIDALSDIADCSVPDFTTQDSIAAMARSVLAMMPERFALAGLSMGGSVALEIMVLAPERVTHLALLDCRPVTDSEEERSRRRGLIELSRKGEFKGVTPKLLPAFLHPDHLGNEALVEVITAQAAGVGRDAFIRQETALINREDRRGVLPTITQPTVVIVGRQDALTPLHHSEYMASRIPGAKLVVVENSGHITTLEQPEAVNRAMREWLLPA